MSIDASEDPDGRVRLTIQGRRTTRDQAEAPARAGLAA